MYKKVYSATLFGVNAQLITVEIDISPGLLQWHIVGLPDAAIKESRQRVAAALKNSGIKIPDKKIVINLSPADIKKEGSLFDLPIAIAILLACDAIHFSQEFIDDTIWLGELALNSMVLPIKGVLPIVADTLKIGKKRVVVPEANFFEARIIEGVEVIPIRHLADIIAIAQGSLPNKPVQKIADEQKREIVDFSDVKGQEAAKRALQIAAAGRHNIMLIGSPGCGKTMLAERFISLLPDLEHEEAVEVSKLYSIAGLLNSYDGLVKERPFRSPHHSISAPGLLGGGSVPKPGEVSFAHHGVLFLDEFLEFKKSVLEQLRQPMEKGSISIVRAQGNISFASSFMLIAAMNPCPCGFYGSKQKECICSSFTREKYLSKLSGPLLDRIDIQVGMQGVSLEKTREKKSISSSELLCQIKIARNKQKERFSSTILCNARMSAKDIEIHSNLSESAHTVLKEFFAQDILSMRTYHKIIKVARTIADLANSDSIEAVHIREACSYRSVDYLLSKLFV